MLRRAHYGFCLAIALLIPSCMNLRSEPELVSFSGSTPPQTVGWVVFSYTQSGQTLTMVHPYLAFRGGEGKIDGKVTSQYRKLLPDTPRMSIPIPRDHMTSVDDPMGSIKVLELPAGQYEFYRYYGNVANNPGPMVTTSTVLVSPKSFSRSFNVTAGTVTYIGNLNHDYSPEGATQPGTRGSRSVKFEIRDERDRDMKLFQSSFPNLKDRPVNFDVKPG